jgi:hypothetical protein
LIKVFLSFILFVFVGHLGWSSTFSGSCARNVVAGWTEWLEAKATQKKKTNASEALGTNELGNFLSFLKKRGNDSNFNKLVDQTEAIFNELTDTAIDDVESKLEESTFSPLILSIISDRFGTTAGHCTASLLCNLEVFGSVTVQLNEKECSAIDDVFSNTPLKFCEQCDPKETTKNASDICSPLFIGWVKLRCKNPELVRQFQVWAEYAKFFKGQNGEQGKSGKTAPPEQKADFAPLLKKVALCHQSDFQKRILDRLYKTAANSIALWVQNFEQLPIAEQAMLMSWAPERVANIKLANDRHLFIAAVSDDSAVIENYGKIRDVGTSTKTKPLKGEMTKEDLRKLILPEIDRQQENLSENNNFWQALALRKGPCKDLLEQRAQLFFAEGDGNNDRKLDLALEYNALDLIPPKKLDELLKDPQKVTKAIERAEDYLEVVGDQAGMPSLQRLIKAQEQINKNMVEQSLLPRLQEMVQKGQTHTARFFLSIDLWGGGKDTFEANYNNIYNLFKWPPQALRFYQLHVTELFCSGMKDILKDQKAEPYQQFIAKEMNKGTVEWARALSLNEIIFFDWKYLNDYTVLSTVCWSIENQEVEKEKAKARKIFRWIIKNKAVLKDVSFKKELADQIGWYGNVGVTEELIKKGVDFWGWERANKSTVLWSVCYRGSEVKDNSELVNNLKEIFELFARGANTSNAEYQPILANQIGLDGNVWVAQILDDMKVDFWEWARGNGHTVLWDVCSYVSKENEKKELQNNARRIFFLFKRSNRINKAKYHSILAKVIGEYGNVWVAAELNKQKVDFWGWTIVDRGKTVLWDVCNKGREANGKEKERGLAREILRLLPKYGQVAERYQQILADRIGEDGEFWVAEILDDLEVDFWEWKTNKNNTVLEELCYRGRDDVLEEAVDKTNTEAIFDLIFDENKPLQDNYKEILAHRIGEEGDVWVAENLQKKGIDFWCWKRREGDPVLWVVCRLLTQKTKENTVSTLQNNARKIFKLFLRSDGIKDPQYQSMIASIIGVYGNVWVAKELQFRHIDFWEWDVLGFTVLEAVCLAGREDRSEQQVRDNMKTIFKLFRQSAKIQELKYKEILANRIGEHGDFWVAEELHQQNIDYWEWRTYNYIDILENVCWHARNENANETSQGNARRIFSLFKQSKRINETKYHSKLAVVIGKCENVWVAEELNGAKIDFWGWTIEDKGKTVLQDVCSFGRKENEEDTSKNRARRIFDLFKQSNWINKSKYHPILAVEIGECGNVWVAGELSKKRVDFWEWTKEDDGNTILWDVCWSSSKENKLDILQNNARQIFDLFMRHNRINAPKYHPLLAAVIGECGNVWVAGELSKKRVDFWEWTTQANLNVLEYVCYRGRDDAAVSYEADDRQNARDIFSLIPDDTLKKPGVQDFLIKRVTSCSKELWVTEYLLKKKVDFWRWIHENQTILTWLIHQEKIEGSKGHPSKKGPVLSALEKIVHSKKLTPEEITQLRNDGSNRVQNAVNSINIFSKRVFG